MWLSSGVWLQLGASIDVEAHPVFDLSLGWSLLGIEAQVVAREHDAMGALFLKLRIPFGVIGYALSD